MIYYSAYHILSLSCCTYGIKSLHQFVFVLHCKQGKLFECVPFFCKQSFPLSLTSSFSFTCSMILFFHRFHTYALFVPSLASPFSPLCGILVLTPYLVHLSILSFAHLFICKVNSTTLLWDFFCNRVC